MATFTEKTNRQLQLENLLISAEIEVLRREREAKREAMITEQMAKNAAECAEKENNASLLDSILG